MGVVPHPPVFADRVFSRVSLPPSLFVLLSVTLPFVFFLLGVCVYVCVEWYHHSHPRHMMCFSRVYPLCVCVCVSLSLCLCLLRVFPSRFCLLSHCVWEYPYPCLCECALVCGRIYMCGVDSLLRLHCACLFVCVGPHGVLLCVHAQMFPIFLFPSPPSFCIHMYSICVSQNVQVCVCVCMHKYFHPFHLSLPHCLWIHVFA